MLLLTQPPLIILSEDLALRFGNVIGGLLNATFGNIVEVILSIAALEKGLYVVVATSLIGSVLSNLLLVLGRYICVSHLPFYITLITLLPPSGCCFLFGGMYFKVQTFNATSNRACSSLLFLAAIGIAIPSAARYLMDSGPDQEATSLLISRGAAIILLFCYSCFLYFQLSTHADIFEEEEDEDDEEPLLTTTAAIIVLASISVLVAVHSEFLTGAIVEVSKTSGLSQVRRWAGPVDPGC